MHFCHEARRVAMTGGLQFATPHAGLRGAMPSVQSHAGRALLGHPKQTDRGVYCRYLHGRSEELRRAYKTGRGLDGRDRLALH